MRRRISFCAILFFLAYTLVGYSTPIAQVINSGVAFQEVGLPSGTVWSVICNGTLYNSTSPIITISLPPGTYNFSVEDVSGYKASPQSGNVTAILDPIRLTTITFSPAIPEFTAASVTLTALCLVALTSLVVFLENKRKTSKQSYDVMVELYTSLKTRHEGSPFVT